MLSVRSMIFQTFRSKNFFHALSTFVYVLSLGIVIQIPGIGEYFEGLRPLLFLSILSALIFYMTGFNRKFIMFSVIYVFLFVSSSLIPMLQEERDYFRLPFRRWLAGILVADLSSWQNSTWVSKGTPLWLSQFFPPAGLIITYAAMGILSGQWWIRFIQCSFADLVSNQLE